MLRMSSQNWNESAIPRFKVLVIGDASSGKTSFIRRFTTGSYSDSEKTTVGLDYVSKCVRLGDGSCVLLQMWDIAGQDRFRPVASVYYRDADAALIVFDVTRQTTFESVPSWKEELLKNTAKMSNPPIMILLANKCDLAGESLLNKRKLNKYCKENGFVAWFETSAKSSINVDESMDFVVQQLVQKQAGRSSRVANSKSVVLTQPIPSKKEGCFC